MAWSPGGSWCPPSSETHGTHGRAGSGMSDATLLPTETHAGVCLLCCPADVTVPAAGQQVAPISSWPL